ncbi:hypothetical protein RB2501_07065 [Robiginitalea biformata HTCC2501]|uniref:Uncharacterized protein n=1 Tax=Robiginitalea biformata (strain ATCC BAA-864 / DSM 15991 / KCTC 12146 / HTCC2501) TaxID=313596 RepID=A4CI83_ROBBH|nr:hypothetical protein RB2501_07065 [Robiginitalea biformata HTCC2501]
MPNKMRFYRFFKYMLSCAHQNSTGSWTVNIEPSFCFRTPEAFCFAFYDQTHQYSRLNIEIQEMKKEIRIVTMPF